MIRSAIISAMGQDGLRALAPNHKFVVARGVAEFRYAREFQQLFPTAEHKVVVADHDFGPPNYWRTVHDWLSRTRLHDRYVVILSTAAELHSDGHAEALKPPILDVFEVMKVLPKVELQWGSADEEAWAALIEAKGDFSAVEYELIRDQPVEAFDKYWNETGEGWIAGDDPLTISP